MRSSSTARSSSRSGLRSRGETTCDFIFGDALALDLASLEPQPNKLVANLPYNIATPLVVESLDGIPSLERWCVMVQREVAERFFAAPRTKAYGAVSVLVQLATRKVGFHAVPPTVFRPRPRVDSALVAFERIEGPPLGPIRPVVHAAFAHRRKTLANSLALRRSRKPLAMPSTRSRQIGQAAGCACRGARTARLRRSRRRASMTELRAPAKLNLALVVGPLRADGRARGRDRPAGDRPL